MHESEELSTSILASQPVDQNTDPSRWQRNLQRFAPLAAVLAFAGCNASAAAEGTPATVTVVVATPAEATPTTTEPQPTQQETTAPATYQKNQLAPSDSFLFPGDMFSGDTAVGYQGTNNLHEALKLPAEQYTGDGLMEFGIATQSRLTYVVDSPHVNADPQLAETVLSQAKDLYPSEAEQDGVLMTAVDRLWKAAASGQNSEKIWFKTLDTKEGYTQVGGSPAEEITQTLIVQRGGDADSVGATTFMQLKAVWRLSPDAGSGTAWKLVKSEEVPVTSPS